MVPPNSPSSQQLEHIVRSATLAPSSHNTQPWLFSVRGQSIELIADRRRALPVNDPLDRELAISCGAALFNLRVAAAADGYATEVVLKPDPGQPDLLARLSVRTAPALEPEAAFSRVIAQRRTYRRRYLAQPVAEHVVRALADAARVEGARLEPLRTETARQAAATLVSEGDAVQWADPSWRRELAVWMHPRRCGDGLAIPVHGAALAQAVVRTFDMGRGVAARDRELADGSPLLTVLGTRDDSELDWLVAGQALQRALLTGVTHGLQASFLNQPIQVSSLRPRLAALAPEAGVPQLLLRWGRPIEEVPASPRRVLAEVIESD